MEKHKPMITLEKTTYIAISADPTITYLAIKAGASEAHPAWAVLIDKIGIEAAMSIRLLAGIALVSALIFAINHDGNLLTDWTLKALTITFTLITIWNTIVWITT